MEKIFEAFLVFLSLMISGLVLGVVLHLIREGFETYIKYIIDNRSK